MFNNKNQHLTTVNVKFKSYFHSRNEDTWQIGNSKQSSPPKERLSRRVECNQAVFFGNVTGESKCTNTGELTPKTTIPRSISAG